MLGAILGWYARKWYDKHRKSKEPPPSAGVNPYAVFEGRITLNQISAPALTGEWEMGRFDPETGVAELTPPKEKIKSEPTRLTTFMDDEDGGEQITVRWEKTRGKLKFSRARRDEIWRLEFYKVADAAEKSMKEQKLQATVPGSAPDGFNPYGGQPGGGVS